MSKKEEKEKVKNKKKEKVKVNKPKEQKVKKEGFFKSVKSEFKKVRWPNRKEMVKYSIATIIFILFFAAFFSIIELIAWLIKTM